MLHTNHLDKRTLLLILLIAGLVVPACKAQINPVVPTRTSVAEFREPASTPTAAPFTISGEFSLTNNSTPGLEVGIETMAIVFEHRPSANDPWETIVVDCSFDPAAPVVLKDELIVHYECQYLKQLPPNAELRTTAEVKIFGNDEIFRLEVNAG
jgi:hypothetical protein